MCGACHGPQGVSRAQIFPSLAGQQKDYLVEQLTAFRARTRGDRDAKAYMWGVAKGLSDKDIEALAAAFAARSPGVSGVKAPPGDLAAGGAIFDGGVEARGVLACATCHGAHGEGMGAFPRLAGQKRDYLIVQLHAFASGARDNATMSLVAKAMTAQDIRAVATYLSSRP
jgi:cytochrome c553